MLYLIEDVNFPIFDEPVEVEANSRKEAIVKYYNCDIDKIKRGS